MTKLLTTVIPTAHQLLVVLISSLLTLPLVGLTAPPAHAQSDQNDYCEIEEIIPTSFPNVYKIRIRFFDTPGNFRISGPTNRLHTRIGISTTDLFTSDTVDLGNGQYVFESLITSSLLGPFPTPQQLNDIDWTVKSPHGFLLEDKGCSKRTDTTQTLPLPEIPTTLTPSGAPATIGGGRCGLQAIPTTDPHQFIIQVVTEGYSGAVKVLTPLIDGKTQTWTFSRGLFGDPPYAEGFAPGEAPPEASIPPTYNIPVYVRDSIITADADNLLRSEDWIVQTPSGITMKCSAPSQPNEIDLTSTSTAPTDLPPLGTGGGDPSITKENSTPPQTIIPPTGTGETPSGTSFTGVEPSSPETTTTRTGGSLLNAWTSNCVYQGDVATFQGLECVVRNLLTVAISLLGLAVLIMFIIGSYQLLMSGGDPKALTGGKNTLTYAVLGLILALSSWFILNLIAQFTGATGILNFSTQIPSP